MKNTIKTKSSILSLEKPAIMGIMNLTPDSFYKDSRFNSKSEDFLKKAEEMLLNGADIIDIGGYSTRPGADVVTENQELERTSYAVEILIKTFGNINVSIDTFRSKVAESAIIAGACMVNDVTGGDGDTEMFNLILKHNIPYILMHTRGTPKNMALHTNYKDLIYDVNFELLLKANYLRKNGVNDVIIDPGFGFAKTLDQNYSILNNIKSFRYSHYPLMVGLSRKSMIYNLLKINSAEALRGTLQLNFYALLQNTSIIRVHDVKEAKESLKLFEKLKQIFV
jgi:dihydropteroate synthase